MRLRNESYHSFKYVKYKYSKTLSRYPTKLLLEFYCNLLSEIRESNHKNSGQILFNKVVFHECLGSVYIVSSASSINLSTSSWKFMPE